jgi:hypothetical protein
MKGIVMKLRLYHDGDSRALNVLRDQLSYFRPIMRKKLSMKSHHLLVVLLLPIAAAPDFAVAHTARPQLSMGAHTVAIAEGSHGGEGNVSGGHFGGHFPADHFGGARRDFHGERFNSHPYIGGFEGGLGLSPFAYPPLYDPGRYAYADPLSPLEPGSPIEPPSLEHSTPNVAYFCPGPNMYYPYLTQCSEGWQQITQ